MTVEPESTTKVCTKCGILKPLEDFSKDSRNRSGLAARCKKCNYANTRKWVKNNIEKSRQYARDYRKAHPEIAARVRDWGLKRRHGITHEEYVRLLEKQGGTCAICGGPANSKDGFFHIDHSHATGKIRGILCHFCNTGLGSMRDSIDILKAAILYLEKNNV